jgi:predicted NBD/HSP70 family sugar kinase
MRIDMFCRTLVVAIAAVHAVNDPELLVLGGPIGKHPWLLERLRLAVAEQFPLSASITASAVDGSAALRGATMRALAEGRQQLLTTSASAS